MTNLRSFDLNLLTVFEAVYEAGAITRAAEKLALSASATSHALGRLRDACRDDLFVRVGQGIAPTPVAQRIYPEVKQALDRLRQSLAEAQGFDPATASRGFALALPHPVGPLWARDLLLHVAPVAPGVTLSFDTRTLPVDQAERMRAGEIDLAVDWITPDDDRFVLRKVFDDRLVLVARRDHPRIRPGMGVAALRAEKFIRTHPRPGRRPHAAMHAEAHFAELGIRPTLMVSEFLEVPYVVARSDMLAVIPATLARHAEQDFGLQSTPLPFAADPVPVLLIWHETRRADDGHRWLRDLVATRIAAAAA